MPKMNDDNWDKKYPGLENTRRFLVSFPVDMLVDVGELAQRQQVAQAEIVRRAVSQYLASQELTD